MSGRKLEREGGMPAGEPVDVIYMLVDGVYVPVEVADDEEVDGDAGDNQA